MAGKKESTTRRTIRVVDFEAESLHEIAQHSSSPSAEELHKIADGHAAASKDETMVTILEEQKKRISEDEKRK